jgi:8-oxo-dGTP pyrophosphatase MutT (NUDIX family)
MGLNYDDNKAHYVTSTCVVIKDGKYLLTKRSPAEKAFPNKWTVPGGKLESCDYRDRKFDTEQGEQWYNVMEDSIRREVLEETGLKVKKLNYITSLVFMRKDGIPSLVLSYYAEHDSGTVRLSHEMTDHAWVSAEEAKEYDLIDGIYEEIDMLDRMLKGEEVGEWKKK